MIAYLLLVAWSLELFRSRRAPGALLLALTCSAACYENFIVVIGTSIGLGPTLESLNALRFYFAAIATPLEIVVATLIAAVAGLRWAQRGLSLAIAWCLAAALIIMGLYQFGFDLQLEPACFMDTVRYVARAWPNQLCSPEQIPLVGMGPPWPLIISSLLILSIGVLIMLNTGWPWLFVGTLIVPVFSFAAPIGEFGVFIVYIGQLIYTIMLIATAMRFTPPAHE